MKNTKKQRSVFGQLVVSHLIVGGIITSALYAGQIQAAGAVSQIQTVNQPGTPTRYSIDEATFTWGLGQNQIMEGFSAEGQSFEYAGNADRVELVRHDVDNVSTGNPCGVFVERLSAAGDVLEANYPSDGSDSGNCDMAAMLSSRVVNRGALDLFSNTGSYPKNVERVDYIYDRGVLAPLTTSALSLSGHVVAEKSGNNPLQIAAVTELDVFGQPSAFGPLILVDRNGCTGETICYGITNLRHNYAFFQNNSFAPQGYPSYLRNSTEPVGMAFVSLEKLGVGAGQVYYGYSYFPDDVDPSIHTLTDVSTFPSNTNDEKIVFGDGPDIYGGAAGYYLGVGLSVATGAVFKDENGDGQVGENEAGISDIGLTLYQDTNGNGVFDPKEDAQIGPTFNTDINGEFRIPGIEDGVYFLLLDESDPELPPAIEVVPGSNPAMIVIQGDDADGINFGFISITGPTDGTDASGTDAGASDAGSTDAGDSDAGSTDAGASDAGSTDAGASDAGSTDAGASDAGSTDAGASDAGSTDAGASDAGSTDAGASDAGSTDAGASDAGSTDAGASDAGSTDAGASDAGSTDAGASDAGSTDAGASDAGSTDAGASDAGSTDAGSTDGGTDVINDGTDETVANPDSANVFQGSMADIFVLANDTDSSGQGLTIIGEPESAHATIVVRDDGTDQYIEYKPEFGFIGMDSFMYSIEDSAGVQSTGTVTVNVLRFSDIDKNGMNDFEECDCESLTIEVGVEGSALGGSSLISFLILTFMIGARRIFRTNRGRVFGVST